MSEMHFTLSIFNNENVSVNELSIEYLVVTIFFHFVSFDYFISMDWAYIHMCVYVFVSVCISSWFNCLTRELTMKRQQNKNLDMDIFLNKKSISREYFFSVGIVR